LPRERAERADGDLFGDYTQRQIENMQPDSRKGYNVALAGRSLASQY
jgi:hypothetical protein